MSREQAVGVFVGQQIQVLLNSGNESAVRAALATLRRGIGKTPGSIPECWAFMFQGFPDELLGRGEQASPAEWAVHSAITMFALHQQGKDPKQERMHQAKATLGLAVASLVRNDDDLARVKRRFDAAVTADSVDELAQHLRGLVQLLRAGKIPLDYQALAVDFYRYHDRDRRDGVRLKWGRDFYRHLRPAKEQEGETTAKEGEQDA